MKKSFFIGSWVFILTAMASVSAIGQADISADRMIVTEQDTIPGTGTYNESDQAAADLTVADQAATDPANAIPGREDPVSRIWNEIDNNNSSVDQAIASQPIKPWSFSSQLGTSYMFSPYFGSAMNMFAAPQVNYAATGKLAFHAGVSVGRTVPVTNLMDEEAPVNAGITNMSTYVAASYRLSKNLVVHGAGTKSVLLVPVDGKLQSMNFNDISIGATYDFGNFSIGATIHRSDAPGYMSPFGGGNNMYGAPLFW